MKAEGIAVVTGAGRGLGRAIALELAHRGFDVVATMRRPDEGKVLVDEAAASGGRLRVARLDVTRPDEFDFPDGTTLLVNNAAVRFKYLPFEETDIEEWRQILETNVFGLVRVTQAAIPKIRASGGGVICTIGSIITINPWPWNIPYKASKTAVGAMNESLSIELKSFNIRLLEVPLGPVETDLMKDSIRFRPPEAADYEAYRSLALRTPELIKSLGPVTTPPGEAARRIVDAIEDDRSPMRVACDPTAEKVVAAWRASTDEDRLKAVRDLLELPQP